MPKFVAALSDDDEVVVLPYVKPPPPMILLSGSEDEDEDISHVTKSSQTAQETKESESHFVVSSSEDQQVRRNDSSLLEGVESQGNNSHNGQIASSPSIQPSRNIFHPSEAAMTDIPSRQTTPTGSVDSTPVPSPTSSTQATPGRKGKGRTTHSNMVKRQFEDFLKGINLPPAKAPTRARKPRTGSPRISEMEPQIGTADPRACSSSESGATTTSTGFISMTAEKSRPRARRNKTANCIPAASSVVGNQQNGTETRDTTSPMDIQFNRTTATSSRTPGTKPKATKRTKTSEEKGQSRIPNKKKKQDENQGLDSTTPKRKEKSKNNSSPPKRLSRRESESAASSGRTSSEIIDLGMPSHWNDEMKKFYGTISTTRFDLSDILWDQPNHSKHWKAPEDKGQRQRDKNRDQFNSQCDICKRFDHSAFSCNRRGCLVKCVYCSGADHLKARCSEDGVCLFCGSNRSTTMRTCSNCMERRPKPPNCKQCGVAGHNEELCPDNWRRYHSTTIDPEQVERELGKLKTRLLRLRKKQRLENQDASTPEQCRSGLVNKKISQETEKLEKEIKELRLKLLNHSKSTSQGPVEYVPRYKQYCCNCAKKGHAYFNCKSEQPKWTYKYKVIPNKPYVIKKLEHKPQKKTQKKTKDKKKGSTSTPTATQNHDSVTATINSVSSAEVEVSSSERVVTSSVDDDEVTIITITNANANKDTETPPASVKERETIDVTTKALIDGQASQKSYNVHLDKELLPAKNVTTSSDSGGAEFTQRKVTKDYPLNSLGSSVTTTMKVTFTNESVVQTQGVTRKEGDISVPNEVASEERRPELGNQSLPAEPTPSLSVSDNIVSSRSRPLMTRWSDAEQNFSEDITLPDSFVTAGSENENFAGMPLPSNPAHHLGFESTILFPPPSPYVFGGKVVPGPEVWRDGFGQIQVPSRAEQQHPPRVEYVQVPVPIPVREEDYLKFQREGFPAQFPFGYGYMPTPTVGIAYPYQQITPPQFPISPKNFSASVSYSTVGQPQYSAEKENPPSPDSTEPIADCPASSEPEPDIIFVEEVKSNAAPAPEAAPPNPVDVSPRRKAPPPKPNIPPKRTTAVPVAPVEEDEIRIGLLRSEWNLFFPAKGKADLIHMLSEELGVAIKLCRDTMSVCISGKDEGAKAISKQNIVEFLQNKAAGLDFTPNFTADALPLKAFNDVQKPPTTKNPAGSAQQHQERTKIFDTDRSISQRNINERDSFVDHPQHIHHRYAPYPYHNRFNDSRDRNFIDHRRRDHYYRDKYRHLPFHPANIRAREANRDSSRRDFRGHNDPRHSSDRNYRGGRGSGSDGRDGRAAGDDSRDGRGSGADNREGRGMGTDNRDGRGSAADHREGRGSGTDNRGGRSSGPDNRDGRGSGAHNREGRGSGTDNREGRGSGTDNREGRVSTDNLKGRVSGTDSLKRNEEPRIFNPYFQRRRRYFEQV